MSRRRRKPKWKHQKLMCRKVVYRTEVLALEALNDFGRERGSVRVYRCWHHGDDEVWHLTSQLYQPKPAKN